MTEEFIDFGKIARLSREMFITEKLDGTNAQIFIDEEMNVRAGSRNRWITVDDDNYGFAKWVKENERELVIGLGAGRHFGEWWGQGCQRGYGLKEKRFSLFNRGRWDETTVPACCHVVPLLHQGDFDTGVIDAVLSDLGTQGSAAAPGFMNPEGIIIYHSAANIYFKKTLKNDKHKTFPERKVKS